MRDTGAGNSASSNHVLDLVIDFTAGANGALAGVYVGQPLDTIKVKMQTFPALYNNAFKCFMETFRKDGIYRGLYAGTIPALAANVAENSVLFGAYGACQKFVGTIFNKEVPQMTPFQNALAGSVAAVFSTFALCPTELVKCKLQAMREQIEAGTLNSKTIDLNKVGPVYITKQIFREEGLRGFFRGLGPTFGREVPGYFFFFGGYELSRYMMTPVGGDKNQIGPVKTALAGGLGGVCLWVAIFPFDVIKSRMQIATGASASMKHIFLEIIKEKGVFGLYMGLGPTIVRTFFASGALFVAYEWTKRNMHFLMG